MQERFFCTAFDSNYLTRGLALYRSLKRHARRFQLWILCLDDLTYYILSQLALPFVRTIRLSELEQCDQRLLTAKKNRSRVEYYFTCKASFLIYILRKVRKVALITYLDADLFFFARPSVLFRALGSNSILIVGHRFPPQLNRLLRFGVYNAGLLSFRRDEHGLRCLHWWRRRCLEWCFDRVESGRFGDQKYLDDWPIRFKGVAVLRHKGAGLAPWNLPNYELRSEAGRVCVDSQPLVLFHFQYLKRLTPWLFDPHLGTYGVPLNSLLRSQVYGAYIQELKEVEQLLSNAVEVSTKFSSIREGNHPTHPGRRLARAVRLLSIPWKLLRGELLIVTPFIRS